MRSNFQDHRGYQIPRVFIFFANVSKKSFFKGKQYSCFFFRSWRPIPGEKIFPHQFRIASHSRNHKKNIKNIYFESKHQQNRVLIRSQSETVKKCFSRKKSYLSRNPFSRNQENRGGICFNWLHPLGLTSWTCMLGRPFKCHSMDLNVQFVLEELLLTATAILTRSTEACDVPYLFLCDALTRSTYGPWHCLG